MKVLDPGDYPTHMMKPMSEVLGRYRNFRAAWILTSTLDSREGGTGPMYQVLILMEPRSQAIFRELHLVAQASRRDGDDLRLELIDEKDSRCIVDLLSRAATFHQAADFSLPADVRTPAPGAN